ncbi:hypothetical protein GVY41_17345 [Frigidibacter albus]|uniref:Uncharacterized protein n=1 Tax=Frigidibacter albus TaxID=1465486 RepID=A0A6L8VJP2_9RHOB|nr:hypothetical protein [Frigidibacter albus]MZQ90575.1 hypothetical protein [Frigidibacter albus]NBE32769.1 hypothetical protein [Frigidibacter albus]GGH60820.1 hypothetical protein GCM10011341_33430 [Frigidibacter albus]
MPGWRRCSRAIRRCPRDRADGLLRLVPSLLERLPDERAPRLAAARSRGYHRPETLPDLLRGS